VTPRHRRTVFVAAFASLLLATWLLAPPVHRGAAVASAPPAATAPRAADAGAARTFPPAVQPPPVAAAGTVPPLPASQVGSDPDGAVGLDADGQLRIDLALRRWFDWHRAAAGELDEPALRFRLQHGLAAQLPPWAVAEALSVYDLYLDYLAASDQLAFDADPMAQLDALRALRIERLGAEIAEAFFADEELAVEARLLLRSIAADPALDEQQRAARLAEVQRRLPPELQPSIELQVAADAERLTALYDTAGIDDSARHAERSELFGADAADRLAALDRQRLDWQHRIDDFIALRTRLAGDGRLDAAQRQHALTQWLQQNLSEAEQRRLLALIEAGQVGG